MPRVVPWTNNHELCQVFNWLYADINKDPKLAQRGVDRVKAWMSRGKVPISVRSTMDLVEVQLSEQKCQYNQTSISQNELRLLYSSVLIRFVNGIEDGQQKGVYAKSLLSIANEIGLPIWIVQVRHAATHGDLPTLNILRNCCVQSLQWLYDNYWVLEVNPEALRDIDEKTTFKLRTLLNYYKVSRKAFLKGEQSERLCKKSLDEFFKAISPNIIQELIIPLIVGVGGMVPVSTKKRVNSPDSKLPDNLISLWMPVLEGLNSRFPNFMFDLICVIINELENADSFVSKENSELLTDDTTLDKENEKKKHPSYAFTLVSWLRHFIVQSYLKNKPLFYRDMIDDILGLCLKKPNIYTVKVLLVIANSDKELGKSIEPFISYINVTLDSNSPSIKEFDKKKDIKMDDEINTLNNELASLKEKFNIKDVNVDEMDVDNDNDNEGLVWKQVNEKEWKSCPIGCLPNGEVPDLYLDIEA